MKEIFPDFGNEFLLTLAAGNRNGVNRRREEVANMS